MEDRKPDAQLDEQAARSTRQLNARARAREAADKVGIGKSQSLFTMVIFSIAAGILIASYVLILGMVIIHKKHTDTGSEAAFEAARELSDITVEHPSTGPVSLCRWRDNGSLFLDAGTEKARSIESIKRTYLKIEEIAKLSGVYSFRHMVQTDEKTLKQLESDLRARLDRAIAQPAAGVAISSKTITGGSGLAPSSNVLTASNTSNVSSASNVSPASNVSIASNALTTSNALSSSGSSGVSNSSNSSSSRIYKSVANLIASRYGMLNPSKLKLNIKLGYNPELSRKDSAQIYTVNPDKFRIAPADTAPNMVQLSFLEPGKKEQLSGLPEKQTIACVAILPAFESPPPAALVLTFPQGTPGFASTILQYLNYKSWEAKGLWNQATAGEVPGGGQLAPPVEPLLLLSEMSPGDALAAEIYHWLKYAGDKIDPQTVIQMFNEPLTLSDSAPDNSRTSEHSFGMVDNEINSCVVTDTGSRQHALMYETKPGGAGQAALARAFLINGLYDLKNQEKPTIPESALPVYVSPLGSCYVSRNPQFDVQLIREFFQDLYATNLAARETLATIKPMQQAVQQSIPQIEQKLNIERDELASLIRRQNKSGKNAQSKADSGKQSVQQRIIIDRISDLKQIVDSDSDTLARTKNLQNLIRNARYNASRAQLNTFELNAQKLRYCRDGISKAPGGDYLLGSKLAFRPVAQALVESDLDNNSSATGSGETSPWLATNLSVSGSQAEVLNDQNGGKPSKASNPNPTNPNLSNPNPTNQNSSNPSSSNPSNRNPSNPSNRNPSSPNSSNQPYSFNAQEDYAHSRTFTSLMFVIDSRSIVANNRPRDKSATFIKAFTKYPFANIKLPQSEVLYYCQTAVKTGSTTKVGWSVLARDFLANRGRLSGEQNQPFVGLPVLAENSSWFSGQNFGISSPGLGCEFQIRTPLPLIENSFENAYLQNAESGQRMPLIPLVTPDML